MKVIETIAEMQAHADTIRMGGGRIALVPTMGYLHAGHLSLAAIGGRHADNVVMSIFVNPAQFGPGEDLDAYPRNFERDRSMAADAGVDVIFAPPASEIYPDGYQTHVVLAELPGHLCGRSRPTHFRGVATVVTKLFNIVKPHVAVFGRKDYQQLLVVRRLVRDLNFDIRIIGGQIVREADGLAMSSRNAYLDPRRRHSALSLSRALEKAREMVRSGVADPARVIGAAEAEIRSCPDTVIDYIEIRDAETLGPVETIDRPALMALAVKVGKPRLIDNCILTP